MENISLSDNQAFMKKQIENTVEIINRFFDNRELSYTALQNALLSLVLLPYESVKRHDKSRIWQGKYEDVKKSIGFSDEVFVPISSCKNYEAKIDKRSQYSFIRKFRNAVAHQNIQICVDGNRLISVVFFNIFPAKCKNCENEYCKAYKLQRRKDGVEDFRVSFTYDQLQSFAQFVANSYLRSITGEEPKIQEAIK